MKRYYMACLDLAGRRAVVVGGGPIALEKTLGLLDAGAVVTVVAPEVVPQLHELDVTWRPVRYSSRHLRGAFLVIAATGERAVDERVSRDAEQRSLLCNVADVPELCNFILPSIYRRDPIVVAVSTGGRIARPREAAARPDRRGGRTAPRRPGASPPGSSAVGQGALRDLRRPARVLRAARGRGAVTVHLVGGGPGDPDLITVRGLELLRQAEAVVYDELAPLELLAELPATALQIPRAGMRQRQIDELLVSLGRRFDTVVRLKGGDPFLFGRGREEVDALAAAGIPHEVVPGVSALTAVPAAAGIPLTHRGLSAQVTVITARSAGDEDLDFEQLAQTPGTLVIFMGVARLEELAERLVAAGKAADTPAAVIANGTTDRQQTVVGRLDEIALLARDLPSPALTVIGPTAALAIASACIGEPIAQLALV